MRAIIPNALVIGVRALGIGQPGRGSLRVMTMWEPAEGGDPRSGRLLGQEAFWETVAEDCSAFDEGFPKPYGEYLVSGCAFSATPVTDLGVGVSLGSLKKVLHVHGERFWSGSSASKPIPFSAMPITWERALGGPKDARNYAGRGQEEDETIGAVLLPNIEHPSKPITSPRDRPPPAGFGALMPAGLPRRDYLGTMNDRWIEKLFPEMPSDYNALYGQQAPEDQQLRAFWQGDEPFALVNLHATRPRWDGRLPGLRARAWVRRVERPTAARPQTPGPAEEPALHLDTVWFFPRHGRVALIWRGLFELYDDDELNVTDVMAALEWIGQERSLDHYAAARARREPGQDLPATDIDLLPEELVVLPPPRPPAAAPPAEPEGPTVLERMKAELTADLGEVWAQMAVERAALAAGGHPTDGIDAAIDAIDPDAVWEKMTAPREAEAAGIDATLEQTRADMVTAGASEETIAGFDIAAAEARVMKAQMDLALAEASLPAMGPPKLPTAAAQVDVLAMLANLKEDLGAQYSEEIDAQIQGLPSGQTETDLVALEDTVREGYRGNAHRQQHLTTLSLESSAERRAAVERAVAAGESLHRWDLTALDLSGLDFRGADLSEAWLESANLSGAKLAGCNLRRAVLTRADLSNADLTGANLTQANLGGIKANDINLTRAQLADAICLGAQLIGATLAETDVSAVDLSRAKLARVDFRRCDAAGLVMTDTDLSDCDFREAKLEAANFTGCVLHRADFSGATLERTLFYECVGDDLRFTGAQAKNMRFSRGENGTSSFARANFRDAHLDKACLGDTRLVGADFRGSTADQAIFSSSDLTRARFDGVRLRQARFERAFLYGASFVAADLMEANLMRARVQGASFEHANLFKINTLRIRLDEGTNFRHANLEGVRFFQPIRDEAPGG